MALKMKQHRDSRYDKEEDVIESDVKEEKIEEVSSKELKEEHAIEKMGEKKEN